MKEFIAKQSEIHVVVIGGPILPGEVRMVPNKNKKWWQFWVSDLEHEVLPPKPSSVEGFVYLHEGEIYACPSGTKDVYPIIFDMEASS